MTSAVPEEKAKDPSATIGDMPVTVYRDPGCNASGEACDELRRLGVTFHEHPVCDLPAASEETNLVKALWQAGLQLPVIRIGDSEFHDYPSAVRRLAGLTNQRKPAAQEG